YAKTVNALIAGDRTRIYIGPSVYVFWAADGDGSFMSLTQQPDSASVRDLLASYQKGIKRADLDPTDFYATAFRANSARAVVRDWLRTTVGEAQDRLARWFARLQIVDAYGQVGPPLGIRSLASALYRDANKEMVAQVPRALMRAAIHVDPLPEM